ncbi:hypothetical protein AB0J52_14970, partial [Spirillospora sp. NPDC049652]
MDDFRRRVVNPERKRTPLAEKALLRSFIHTAGNVWFEIDIGKAVSAASASGRRRTGPGSPAAGCPF